jgi:hypothetical protein
MAKEATRGLTHQAEKTPEGNEAENAPYRTFGLTVGVSHISS